MIMSHRALVTDVILKVKLFHFGLEFPEQQNKQNGEINVFYDLFPNYEEAMKCTFVVLLLLRVPPAMVAFQQSSDSKSSDGKFERKHSSSTATSSSS